jgi:hypothetical protein
MEGCIELAKMGTFLNIHNDDIRRKRKAETSVKRVVCLQVLCMSIQCLAQSISAVPLTLIEIHTFAHVICAIGIYILWFQVSRKLWWCEREPELKNILETVGCLGSDLACRRRF